MIVIILGLLLAGVVGGQIIRDLQQRVEELIQELRDRSEYTPTTYVHPMERWTHDAILDARNAYIDSGWIPPGYHLYEVRVYGAYEFIAGVVAANRAEAIERIRQGYVVYGATPQAMRDTNTWCESGYDTFMSGLSAVDDGSPVYDDYYDCVGVMRVYPAAEQAVRRYAFTFIYGDVLVDDRYRVYRATVEAAGLYAALDELFSGRVKLVNTADPELIIYPENEGRVAAAFALLTPEKTVGDYAFFSSVDGANDTTATYEVISDPVVAEPAAA